MSGIISLGRRETEMPPNTIMMKIIINMVTGLSTEMFAIFIVYFSISGNISSSVIFNFFVILNEFSQIP